MPENRDNQSDLSGQIFKLADQACQARYGLSVSGLFKRVKDGTMEDPAQASDILILLDLMSEDEILAATA